MREMRKNGAIDFFSDDVIVCIVFIPDIMCHSRHHKYLSPTQFLCGQLQQCLLTMLTYSTQLNYTFC